jgi:hypothetical protein
VTTVSTACGFFGVEYKPFDLPIVFSIDTTGQISVAAAAPQIVTPLGEFSIKGGVFDTLQKNDPATLLVVIRHRKDGVALDSAYRIAARQELVAVLNGESELRFTNNRVFVDASKGSIKRIEFRPLNPPTEHSVPPSAPVRESGVLLADPLTSDRQTSFLNCTRQADGFHILGDNGTCYPSGFENTDFADVEISVTASWLGGNPTATYGLVFRDLYYLIFSGNGQWTLTQYGGAGYLIPPTRNSAVTVGINSIRVRTKGSNIQCFFNGTKLGEINDSEKLHGSINFHAYGGADGGRNHVVFSDLIVRSID